MAHRTFDDFFHRLSIAAEIPRGVPRDSDVTEARQFAILRSDGSSPQVYGDQEWVKYGADLELSGEPGAIVERDIRISYGPWRSLNSIPPRWRIGGSHKTKGWTIYLDDVLEMFAPNAELAQRVVDTMNAAEGGPVDSESLVEAAVEHALVAYDFDPNDPGMAPIGFARAAVQHALGALGAKP